MDIAHWGPDGSDGHLVICLNPSDTRHRLIHQRHLTLAVLPVDADHPYAGPGEHVLVALHLNPGLTVNHQGCTTGYACVGCETELLDSILSWKRGTLREHADGSDTAAGDAPFHLADPSAARSAIDGAKQRLTGTGE